MSRLLPIALLLLAGCTTIVPPPEGDVDRRAIYQEIADALPDADFGWGTAPGVIEMSASAKAEAAPLRPDNLVCTERGFRIHYQVYRPSSVWIPYSAIKEVSWSWNTFPNVFLAATIVVPLQSVRATVVFDATKTPGLLSRLASDATRLEGISREIGLGGPWSHAQNVKWKIEDDRIAHGEGMLSLHFGYVSLIPAWLPHGGQALVKARAFAWAMANADAPDLEALPADKP